MFRAMLVVVLFSATVAQADTSKMPERFDEVLPWLLWADDCAARMIPLPSGKMKEQDDFPQTYAQHSFRLFVITCLSVSSHMVDRPDLAAKHIQTVPMIRAAEKLTNGGGEKFFTLEATGVQARHIAQTGDIPGARKKLEDTIQRLGEIDEGLRGYVGFQRMMVELHALIGFCSPTALQDRSEATNKAFQTQTNALLKTLNASPMMAKSCYMIVLKRNGREAAAALAHNKVCTPICKLFLLFQDIEISFLLDDRKHAQALMKIVDKTCETIPEREGKFNLQTAASNLYRLHRLLGNDAKAAKYKDLVPKTDQGFTRIMRVVFELVDAALVKDDKKTPTTWKEVIKLVNEPVTWPFMREHVLYNVAYHVSAIGKGDLLLDLLKNEERYGVKAAIAIGITHGLWDYKMIEQLRKQN